MRPSTFIPHKSSDRSYAFGSTVKERTTSFTQKYRYGFNNQEQEIELGEYYSFEYRVHDARLGRFMSVDPLAPEFVELSVYQFASNSPIWAVDIEGLESSKPSVTSYTVAAGDGLWTLAQKLNVTISQLVDYSKKGNLQLSSSASYIKGASNGQWAIHPGTVVTLTVPARPHKPNGNITPVYNNINFNRLAIPATSTNNCHYLNQTTAGPSSRGNGQSFRFNGLPFDIKMSWGINVYGDSRSGDPIGLKKGKIKASIDLSSEEMKMLNIFLSKEPGGYQHPKSLGDKRENNKENSSEVPDKIEEGEKIRERNTNKHPANNKQENRTVEPKLNQPIAQNTTSDAKSINQTSGYDPPTPPGYFMTHGYTGDNNNCWFKFEKSNNGQVISTIWYYQKVNYNGTRLSPAKRVSGNGSFN